MEEKIIKYRVTNGYFIFGKSGVVVERAGRMAFMKLYPNLSLSKIISIKVVDRNPDKDIYVRDFTVKARPRKNPIKVTDVYRDSDRMVNFTKKSPNHMVMKIKPDVAAKKRKEAREEVLKGARQGDSLSYFITWYGGVDISKDEVRQIYADYKRGKLK